MMEPHATQAAWEGDKLVLHTANEMLNQGQAAIARTLKIPPENVRLVSPYIGGGFCAKLLVNADALLAAIAAPPPKPPAKTSPTPHPGVHLPPHRPATLPSIRPGTAR